MLEREVHLLRESIPRFDELAATIERDPRMSLRPGPTDTTPERTQWGALSRGPVRGNLTLENIIGEGGMGQVHQATQLSLGRKVAVKSLRQDAKRPEAVFNLLHEAWVTGSLEHPNVVPVHDMCLDDAGEPLIVLKRIEGQSWSTLIAQPEVIRSRFGAEEPLLWHLGILMQICTTVHFAHSRGVIHRDLKPENVMIGPYGEVYLLDWGIAVALRDDGSGRLPLASSVREMAGTPVYMAPEMLAQPGAVLSERTDVYLLGAILFELLSGKPPHQGRTVMQILMQVVASDPNFPTDAPPELVELCRVAMARRPDDRLASAEALRRGLQTFLARRPSLQLTAQAEACLAELRSLSEDPPAGPDVSSEDAADVRRRLRYKLLGECRFGYQQALSIWPENPQALAGLRAAVSTMLDHEIRHGDHRAAAALLSDLSSPEPELERAVEALRRRNEAEAAEAANARTLARSLDPQVGTRTRRFVMAVLGVLWTVLPMVRARWGTARLDWSDVVTAPIFFLVVTSALAVWARDTMTRTVVNKRIMATLIATFALLLVTDLACLAGGLTPLDALRMHPFVDMAVIWTALISIDTRFWPAGIMASATAVSTLVWPTSLFVSMGICNLALATNALLVWREPAAPDPVEPAAQPPQTSG